MFRCCDLRHVNGDALLEPADDGLVAVPVPAVRPAVQDGRPAGDGPHVRRLHDEDGAYSLVGG